jgi:hypothetical protein
MAIIQDPAMIWKSGRSPCHKSSRDYSMRITPQISTPVRLKNSLGIVVHYVPQSPDKRYVCISC